MESKKMKVLLVKFFRRDIKEQEDRKAQLSDTKNMCTKFEVNPSSNSRVIWATNLRRKKKKNNNNNKNNGGETEQNQEVFH